jgi:hypothetical protein
MPRKRLSNLFEEVLDLWSGDLFNQLNPLLENEEINQVGLEWIENIEEIEEHLHWGEPNEGSIDE